MSHLGTLVWIGDHSTDEFRDAFEFCVANAAQIALRTDIDDALHRPADLVRHVLVARTNPAPLGRRHLDRLADVYPDASVTNLLGSLCEGIRIADEVESPSERLYWHRWNEMLPRWLGVNAPNAHALELAHPAKHSVAVVASTYHDAEPLMELAESAGASVVWCRQGDDRRVRNVDVIWWDDSAASPASANGWRRRLETLGQTHQGTRHAWIANAPRLHQQHAASVGGVDVVLSKPQRLNGLLEMLNSRATTSVITSKAA